MDHILAKSHEKCLKSVGLCVDMATRDNGGGGRSGGECLRNANAKGNASHSARCFTSSANSASVTKNARWAGDRQRKTEACSGNSRVAAGDLHGEREYK